MDSLDEGCELRLQSLMLRLVFVCHFLLRTLIFLSQYHVQHTESVANSDGPACLLRRWIEHFSLVPSEFASKAPIHLPHLGR